MAFLNGIAALWWIWLIVTILALSCAVWLMLRYFNPPEPETEPHSSWWGSSQVFGAFENMAAALIISLVGMVSLLLLVVAAFGHLFNYNPMVGWGATAGIVVTIVYLIAANVRHQFSQKEETS